MHLDWRHPGALLRGRLEGNSRRGGRCDETILPLNAFKMSAVALDTPQPDVFLHTSGRLVVDFQKTTCNPILQSSEDEKSLASTPAPQTTVAQMMKIKSRRGFEIIAVVHEVSDTRNPVAPF